MHIEKKRRDKMTDVDNNNKKNPFSAHASYLILQLVPLQCFTKSGFKEGLKNSGGRLHQNV